MALEMKKGSRWWYARFYVDGKAKTFNLEIPIRGERPVSLKKGPFDPRFIESRGRAQEKHDQLKLTILRPKQPEEYVQKLHEIRTGHRIESIALMDMANEWVALPRKRTVASNYLTTGRTRIERFVAFVTGSYPKVKTMADVTPAVARAFMKHEESTGISGRTYNGVLGLMKSIFHHLAHEANVMHNPFDGIPTKEMETVHRRPFTQKELDAILKSVEKDSFLRPIVITGVCTAMRLGDCCCLQWDAVDLNQGFVTVKTSKTGETTDIPMFAMLRQLLSETPRTKSPYVFPKQAKMYRTNRSGISYRLRGMFEAAGFFDKNENEQEETDGSEWQTVSRDAIPTGEDFERVLHTLRTIPESRMPGDKRERVVAAFELFAGGKTVTQTAEERGVVKSTVSAYLRTVEEVTGLELRSTRKRQKRERLKHLGDVHASRENGKRRASVRDFHSFRVTWITLALSAGVPLELVQRVTGHRTTDVVLKHYFRPGRDAFKQAIESAMPKMLTESAAEKTIDVETTESDQGELLEAALKSLEGVTGKANQARVAKAVSLIQAARAL